MNHCTSLQIVCETLHGYECVQFKKNHIVFERYIIALHRGPVACSLTLQLRLGEIEKRRVCWDCPTPPQENTEDIWFIDGGDELDPWDSNPRLCVAVLFNFAFVLSLIVHRSCFDSSVRSALDCKSRSRVRSKIQAYVLLYVFESRNLKVGTFGMGSIPMMSFTVQRWTREIQEWGLNSHSRINL